MSVPRLSRTRSAEFFHSASLLEHDLLQESHEKKTAPTLVHPQPYVRSHSLPIVSSLSSKHQAHTSPRSGCEKKQKSSTDVFRSCTFLIVPGGHDIPAARSKILSGVVKRNGGSITSELSSTVTHIVVSSANAAWFQQVLVMLIKKPELRNCRACVCSPEWIPDCVKNKTFLSDKKYFISFQSAIEYGATFFQGTERESGAISSEFEDQHEEPSADDDDDDLTKKISRSAAQIDSPRWQESLELQSAEATAAPTLMLSVAQEDDSALYDYASFPASSCSSSSSSSSISRLPPSSLYSLPQNAPLVSAALSDPLWAAGDFLNPDYEIKHDSWVDKNRAKLACQVNSGAAVNHNYHLTGAFEKLEETYRAVGDKWREYNYRKVVGLLKTYPKRIDFTDIPVLQELHGIGKKTAAKIEELLRTGECQRVMSLENNERIAAFHLFTNIWGVGAATASKWWNAGLRTLDDVRAKAKLSTSQSVALSYYEDILTRIPRDEVAAIEAVVQQNATELLQGAFVKCCGSFRRGKPDCGDCDMLVTHRDPDPKVQEKLSDFLKPLLDRLHSSGFLVGDLSVPSGRSAHSHALYMGLCMLPKGHPQFSGIARRIDIKVYPAPHFAFALLYFTGSDHFNRSMRWFANRKGFTLSDHGLSPAVRVAGAGRIWTGPSIYCRTERDIFKALGLEFIPPQGRNCYKNIQLPLTVGGVPEPAGAVDCVSNLCDDPASDRNNDP